MRNKQFSVLMMGLLVMTPMILAAAESSLVIKKIGKDLYEADGGPYIQTKGCEAFSYSETVTLKSNGLSKSWLVFADGSTCVVVRLIKKGRNDIPPQPSPPGKRPEPIIN